MNMTMCAGFYALVKRIVNMLTGKKGRAQIAKTGLTKS